ncbi:hypothetical protein [Ornithinimicrobium sp. W1665]|uniref:hypothetical protein n=1 Tax=Ornithinimicrobium sp. W1665 TaxID=3416666 RepID=UPI003D6AFF6D
MASPTRRARSMTARASRWLTASSPPSRVPRARVGGEALRTTSDARRRHIRPTRPAGRTSRGLTCCGPVTPPNTSGTTFSLTVPG